MEILGPAGRGNVDEAAVASAVEHAVENAEAEFQRTSEVQRTALMQQLEAAATEAETTRLAAAREVEAAAQEAEAVAKEAENQAVPQLGFPLPRPGA